jgi:FolB domain-containing protein
LLDKIFVTNLRAYGIVGVNAWERLHPQEMLINLALDVDTTSAGAGDDLSRSVSYSDIARQAQALAESAARLTLEALAADLANLCLAHPGVQSVTVRVEKPGILPFAGSVGVEITRPVRES